MADEPAAGGAPPPPNWQQPPPAPPGGPPPPEGATSAPGPGVAITGAAWWSIVSIVALVLAVTLQEDGDNGWGRVGVWAGAVLVAAVVTLAPAARQQLKLRPEVAWRIAATGGAALVAYWVLFVLPVISDNVSFLATVGCAAGAWAAWNAPGRPAG